MLTVILSLLALCSAALDVWAVYNDSWLEYIFKPLTMLLIIVIAMRERRPESSYYKKMILCGLFCSLLGDVLLMMPQDLFLPGLVSFLIAHLFYIAAFVYMAGRQATRWILLPFVAYGGVMLWILLPRAGGMKIPVIIYMAVILAMAWQAANRWLVSRQSGTLLAMMGAILFVVSDSALAYNRFVEPFPAAPLLVMGTYFTAQWCIAFSVSIKRRVFLRFSLVQAGRRRRALEKEAPHLSRH
jgi:uncharacterized membrane protein YhhN